jgi:hypothetical protein
MKELSDIQQAILTQWRSVMPMWVTHLQKMVRLYEKLDQAEELVKEEMRKGKSEQQAIETQYISLLNPNRSPLAEKR